MVKKKFPVSVTGYSCPLCGTICDSKSMVSKTEHEFDNGVEHNTDPCYRWVETHKCKNCKATYLINNGT